MLKLLKHSQLKEKEVQFLNILTLQSFTSHTLHNNDVNFITFVNVTKRNNLAVIVILYFLKQRKMSFYLSEFSG